MWNFFRRLLLGTVVEALLDAGVDLDFASIAISFSDDSAFRVPRLNNYMRFKGELTATLTEPMDHAALRRLEDKLDDAWPELLKVVDIPIGDRLENERNHVRARQEGRRLVVSFDLEAD